MRYLLILLSVLAIIMFPDIIVLGLALGVIVFSITKNKNKFMEKFWAVLKMLITFVISIPIFIIYFFVLFMMFLEQKTIGKKKKTDECYYGPLG